MVNTSSPMVLELSTVTIFMNLFSIRISEVSVSLYKWKHPHFATYSNLIFCQLPVKCLSGSLPQKGTTHIEKPGQRVPQGLTPEWPDMHYTWLIWLIFPYFPEISYKQTKFTLQKMNLCPLLCLHPSPNLLQLQCLWSQTLKPKSQSQKGEKRLWHAVFLIPAFNHLGPDKFNS